MPQQRAALVTGGTRGIGRAIATALAQENHSITVTARSPQAVEETVQAFEAADVPVLGVVADVSDKEDAARLLSEHQERFGRLDVLVNNAGVFASGPVAHFDADALDDLMRVNVRSVHLVTQAAIPMLTKAGAEHGSALVVNVSSVLGRYGQAPAAGYSASKGAVLALTQALHTELADLGVGVTALTPGIVATDMTSALPVPPEELIQADDLGEAVRFLVRTSASCVVPEIPLIRRTDRFFTPL
jgi:NAD(P)-dependent dehydrogenase (short-subunit alcohol dehydrogenase family)